MAYGLMAFVGLCAISADAAMDRNRVESFEKRVRPLLANRCWQCHGAKKQQAGLRLDSAEAVAKGGDSGPVVRPGDAAGSRLIQAVRHDGELKMPPQKRLRESEIATLIEWVDQGAGWPTSPRPTGADGAGLFSQSQKSYWAFQPIRSPQPPVAATGHRILSPVDRFLIASLKQQRLSPAPPADKPTLLRRVTFDLLGLPPTPDEIRSFLADASPGAFDRVVDRLLSSPHYGQRWGRHWLDVARFVETVGPSGQAVMPSAWRYRDYVIGAFNADKPYDEFVIEQLAGDLLSASPDQIAERTIATGFLMFGPKPIAEQDKEKLVLDLIDEQIDVTGRAFLGLTIACARCHDHKFDPIPTRDYYSLAGIFYSTKTLRSRDPTRWMEWELDVPGRTEKMLVLAVQDGAPTDLRVHIRGSHRSLGKPSPRRFLQIIAGEDHAPIASKQSGRLELARWIANPENPLTARVMVNRIWQWHFGTGLVATSDNLGFAGERPSHPELLDWLASRFIDHGWSVKSMHRLLLNSSAFQMSSKNRSRHAGRDGHVVDPENRLLWRFKPRRLEAEELRDAMLAGSGRLDHSAGGSHLDYHVRYLDGVPGDDGLAFLNLGGKTYHPYYRNCRSVYLPVIRQRLPKIFRRFDAGDPNEVKSKRTETTVAPQALFMMNNAFVRQQSFHLARELLNLRNATTEDRLRQAYIQLFGRPPTAVETRAGLDYLRHYGEALRRLGRSQTVGFSTGTKLVVTIERAHHGFRAMTPTIAKILRDPSDFRIRLSVTSVERERAHHNHPADWEPLALVRASTATQERLPIESDGSLRIDGDSPLPARYELVAETDLARIGAIRLEILPDREQSAEKFGRDLLAIAEIRLATAPRGKSNVEMRPAGLHNATAQIAEDRLTISPVIDSDQNTNWPVGPEGHHTSVVILETEDPRLAPWQSYCRALFCSNEFIYVE